MPRCVTFSMLTALAVGASVSCSACTGSPSPSPVVSAALPSPLTYATQALDLIDTNLYVGPGWPSSRAVALQRIQGVARTTDTYEALRGALAAAGQHEGDLISSADMGTVPPSTEEPATTSTDGVTTITLPGFADISARPGSGQPTAAERSYVRRGSAVIANAAALTTCGWVVDVRGNGSIDVPVLIAAVAPLLPTGPALVEVDRTGKEVRVTLDDNAVKMDATRVVLPLDPVHRTTQPVVVLQDGATARAGEAVVLAFDGRDRSTTIGAPTAGDTTDGTTEVLPDGAHLYVTRWRMAARNGHPTAGPLVPDQTLGAPGAADPNLAVTAARSWLRDQCR